MPESNADAEEQSQPRRERSSLRETADEMIFVFLIFMFVSVFLVEHYKIPSGSMTPTLLGGKVARPDLNDDGKPDLVYWKGSLEEAPLSFVQGEERLVAAPEIVPTQEQSKQWLEDRQVRLVNNRILVNKMSFWFRPPRVGDIAVFKVPEAIWKREAPIYIKRVVGEPGQTLTFDAEGALEIDGGRVTEPAFFQTQRYETRLYNMQPGFDYQDEIDYQREGLGRERIVCIRPDEDNYYMFGDNTRGSLDSRYWGGVPERNFRGVAFLRVYPFGQFARLE